MSELKLEDVRLYKPKNVNKENVRVWVDALRSSRFRQVDSVLAKKSRTTGRWGHCCLGVACEVAGTAERVVAGGTFETVRKFDGADVDLPRSVMRWLGVGLADPVVEVRGGDGRWRRDATLAVLNDDHGFTFKMIADLIERDWL